MASISCVSDLNFDADANGGKPKANGGKANGKPSKTAAAKARTSPEAAEPDTGGRVNGFQPKFGELE